MSILITELMLVFVWRTGFRNGGLPLDFEASSFKTLHVVPEGSRSVGTTEDVLVQIQTPDEILILPSLSQTRKLHIHASIIVKHVIALAEESSKLANTDVLAHFQLSDLVVLRAGDVTVIHADNAALFLGDAGLTESIVTPGSLVLSNGETGHLCAVVKTGELGQGTPAAANVQHGLAFLEADLLANNGHLVILQFLEGFFTIGVGDDSGGVDHARAKEPGVVVVTPIVVRTDLFLVLGLGVEEHIDKEGADDELEQVHSEGEAGPVVAVFQDLENIAIEVNQAVQVHFRKGLHGDLVASAPFRTVFVALEGNVVLNGATGELDFLVGAGAEGGGVGPEGHEDRENGYESEEDEGFLSTTEQVGQKARDSDDGAAQQEVGEALVSRTICWQGRIVNALGLWEEVSMVLDRWAIRQQWGWRN